MKKLLFNALICTTFAFNSQNVTTQTIEKSGFLEMGLSTLLLQPSDRDLMSFFGIGFSGGKYVTKYSYVGFEANLNFLISKQEEIGTFQYTAVYVNGSTTRTGTITKAYNVFPILGTWSLALNLSEKVQFNVGPVLGTTLFHFYPQFNPSPNDERIHNKPEIPEKTKAAFSYGGEGGLLFRLWEGEMGDTYLGVRYKYLRNTGTTFDEDKFGGINHQIKLVLNLTW